mgnify:CR=1 FL=1
MKDKNTIDKETEQERSVNEISAPGNILSSSKSSSMNNDVSCIYDNKNHGVGSVIINEDGREYICTSDGTWQVKEKK